MIKFIRFTALLSGLSLLSVALHANEPAPLTVVTNDSSVWLPLYGENMWSYYHPDWSGAFPGGKSNRFHEQYVQQQWTKHPVTKDWLITNRDYVFDGEWFAVEWFYRATYLDDGFQEWETTLGIGRLKEGRMVLWTEYFDDSVGDLQRLGLMPKPDITDPVFPWPAKATIQQPYRP